MENTIKISRDEVIERLKKGGIRPSIQRICILEYLLSHRTHPSVEDVYVNLSPTIPTLSRTTVYNTLDQFCKKGIILNITIDEKMVHYDAYTHRHAHFFCSQCNKIYDIDQQFDIPNDTIPQGFQVQSSFVNYVGLCEKCAKTKIN